MTPLVATTSATYYAYSYAIVCMNKGEERTVMVACSLYI